MPARRLLMRKIREVLRLKHERGLSHRAIAQACAIGVGTVTLYLKRTAQQGFGWPLPAELNDAALEARCFRRVLAASAWLGPGSSRWLQRSHTGVHVASSRFGPSW